MLITNRSYFILGLEFCFLFVCVGFEFFWWVFCCLSGWWVFWGVCFVFWVLGFFGGDGGFVFVFILRERERIGRQCTETVGFNS